jgi:hypothetical protein
MRCQRNRWEDSKMRKMQAFVGVRLRTDDFNESTLRKSGGRD